VTISSFFLELRSAYQSEMDDLTFDSEGRDVLQKRLVAKRKEIDFLLQMMEISPEMVAVVFHQGFRFKSAAVMDHLLSLDADELPDWDSLSDAIELTPWAQTLAELILAQDRGNWFMTLAAALSYMYSKPATGKQARGADDDGDEDDEDRDEDDRDDDDRDEWDEDAEGERAREEAGAEWLAEQGFDRKD
jgi:hypothetical protein